MTVNKSVGEIPTIDCNLITIQTADKEFGFDTANKLKVEVQSEEEKAVKLVVKGVLRAQKPAITTVTGNQLTLTDNVFNPDLALILQGGTIKYNSIYTFTSSGTTSAGPYCIKLTNNSYATFTNPHDLKAGDTIVYDDSENIFKVSISGVITEVEGAIATSVSGSLLETVKTTGTVVMGYTPPLSGTTDKGKTFTLNAYSAQYDGSGQIVRYEKISYPNCTGVPVAFSSEDGAFRAPEYTINSAPKTGEAPYYISYVKDLPTLV